MGTPNKQIGWSQEASLLQIISRQLEQLAGLIGAAVAGTPGALKVSDGTAINSTTYKRISDDAGNLAGLYLTTNGINNYAGAPLANLNSAFGEIALNSITTGQYNNAFGCYALQAATITSYNVAIGTSAMYSYNDLEGSGTKGQNTVVGDFACYQMVTGKWNTLMGASCYQNGSGGTFNTAVGAHAGEGAGAGSWNVFLGVYSGASCTGTNNIVIGTAGGGGGITTGINNIIINGAETRTAITTGSRNVIIGGATGLVNGDDQVVIGTGGNVRRMSFDSTGQMNIATTPTTGTGGTTEKMLVRDTGTGAIKQVNFPLTIFGNYATWTTATLNAWRQWSRNTSNMLTGDSTGGAITTASLTLGDFLDMNFFAVTGRTTLRNIVFSVREPAGLGSCTFEILIAKADLTPNVSVGRGSETNYQVLMQQQFTMAAFSGSMIKNNFTINAHTLSASTAIFMAYRQINGSVGALQGVNLTLEFI